jgi:hypothetical protein
MSTVDRGGLKAAFAKFGKQEESEAERKLLGRTAEAKEEATTRPADSDEVATTYVAPINMPSGLIPRPNLHREAVRQMSFRCPMSLATELRRKAAFNQLENQEIIIEGLKRVLAELPTPPEGWNPA